MTLYETVARRVAPKLLYLVMATTCANYASASIVSFSFSARIDQLSEYTTSTGQSNDVSGSEFMGAAISTGFLIDGLLTYDTNAAISPIPNLFPPVTGTYNIYISPLATSRLRLTIPSGGLSFENYDTGLIVQVADHASSLGNADIFSVGNLTYASPGKTAFTNLSLFDYTGRAFDNALIPTTVNFSDFGTRLLSIGFMDEATRNQLNVQSTVLSFAPISVAVPEPGTYALALIGLFVMSASLRSNRSKQASSAHR